MAASRQCARLRLAPVEALEIVAAHVHLAADLDDLGRVTLQTQRNAAHGAHVAADVLAGLTIATRRGLDQHAVLVAQVDRQTVELQFDRILDVRIAFAQAEFAPHARIEGLRTARLGIGLGADRQHRHAMTHRRELRQRFAANALGR